MMPCSTYPASSRSDFTVRTFRPNAAMTGVWSLPVRPGMPAAGESTCRRGIYLQQHRTQVATILELFDAPVMVNNCPIRSTSTVPLQSLALLNSAFVRSRAAAFATAVVSRGSSPDDIRRSLLTAFNREPTPVEQQASRQFLQKQAEGYGISRTSNQRAWNDYCQMLLASNAFLYVE
jgi:hypothetical protein